MRKAKRIRYFCDFCKRSAGTITAMKKHEIGCTNNPDRKCGMCQQAQITQAPLVDIVKAVGDGKGPEALARMQAVAGGDEIDGGCPACLLAAIRRSKVGCYLKWNFKKAKEKFWAIVNEWERERSESFWE